MDLLDIKETVGIKIDKQYYDFFMNKTARGGEKERSLFKTDYQRFLWAFILGINEGKKLPLSKNTESSFKWAIVKHQANISKMMIGLIVQEMYKDNIDALKEEFEQALETGESFSDKLKEALEEYANAGFKIMYEKTMLCPDYIENVDEIIKDIIGEE